MKTTSSPDYRGINFACIMDVILTTGISVEYSFHRDPETLQTGFPERKEWRRINPKILDKENRLA